MDLVKVIKKPTKPFSKFDKENINSTIKAEFTKEGKDSSLTIGGSKTGKAKDAFVTFSKTFKKGSKKAVRPKRGGGPDWINTHEPGPQGNPAVIKKIKNSREFHIANPGIKDVADYSLIYGKPIKLTTKKKKKKKK